MADVRTNATRTLVAALLVICVAGCSPNKRLFRHADRTAYESQLGDLQFYIDREVYLSRMLESRESGVSPDHQIRKLAGRRIEEILLKKETPGVLVGIEGKELLISFEPPRAGEERVFRFVPVDPSSRAAYKLLVVPSDSRARYKLTRTQRHKVFGILFEEVDTWYSTDSPGLISLVHYDGLDYKLGRFEGKYEDLDVDRHGFPDIGKDELIFVNYSCPLLKIEEENLHALDREGRELPGRVLD